MALTVATNGNNEVKQDGVSEVAEKFARLNTDPKMEPLELEHLIGFTSTYLNSICIHPLKPNYFCHSVGPTLIIGNFEDQHSQHLLKKHDTPISCITISECGSMIASGQYGSQILKNTSIVNLWDFKDFDNVSLMYSFSGTYDKVHQLLFSPDSKFLIATDKNGLFIVWDTQTFETVFSKKITNNEPNAKQILNINALHIVRMIPDSSLASKHNCYFILVSYGYDLYEWRLSYSVHHMQYILSKQRKFSFPPSRSFYRELTHISSYNPYPNQQQNKAIIIGSTSVGEIFFFNAEHYLFINSFQACSQGANISVFLNEYTVFVGGGDGTVKKVCFNTNNQTWYIANGVQLDAAINTLQLSQDKKNL